MSVSERLIVGLALVAAVGLGACSEDAADCPRTATFVLANSTALDLRVRVPNVSDSVFVAPPDSDVVLGRFTGASANGYPDVALLMGCLTASEATTDTQVYRAAPFASTAAWRLVEPSDCEGTFTLEIDSTALGVEGDTDSVCADTTLARSWPPRR